MNLDKTKVFADLTKRHLEGDSTARDLLDAFKTTLDDGYCLFNAYEEWKGAFSFYPGRTDTLSLIANLAQKIAHYATDDTLQMFAEPEWRELVALRGPFNCAVRYICANCGVNYAGLRQSGFDDRMPAICNSCGDVWLQSGYDNTPLPECDCGGSFLHSGCPKCRSEKTEGEIYFSSYEYFQTHKWKEKRG
ncbi:hypothetical protein [Ereboglobus luteus]|uniref:hypothetical protein n=1 Tax=Ereboglobus luteus TaxID=1796921 RepID=UPI0012600D2F|nr:hypothetical protein [Ereboglobus luteus]